MVCHLAPWQKPSQREGGLLGPREVGTGPPSRPSSPAAATCGGGRRSCPAGVPHRLPSAGALPINRTQERGLTTRREGRGRGGEPSAAGSVQALGSEGGRRGRPCRGLRRLRSARPPPAPGTVRLFHSPWPALAPPGGAAGVTAIGWGVWRDGPGNGTTGGEGAAARGQRPSATPLRRGRQGGTPLRPGGRAGRERRGRGHVRTCPPSLGKTSRSRPRGPRGTHESLNLRPAAARLPRGAERGEGTER